MSTLTITPASGAITSKQTVCRVDVTAAPANDTTAYNANAYPTSPEIRYYLDFVVGGVQQGKSYVFSPNPSDGSHTFNNYIFPSAGAWTVNLKKASNDVDTSISVTVA